MYPIFVVLSPSERKSYNILSYIELQVRTRLYWSQNNNDFCNPEGTLAWSYVAIFLQKSAQNLE